MKCKYEEYKEIYISHFQMFFFSLTKEYVSNLVNIAGFGLNNYQFCKSYGVIDCIFNTLENSSIENKLHYNYKLFDGVIPKVNKDLISDIEKWIINPSNKIDPFFKRSCIFYKGAISKELYFYLLLRMDFGCDYQLQKEIYLNILKRLSRGDLSYIWKVGKRFNKINSLKEYCFYEIFDEMKLNNNIDRNKDLPDMIEL